MKRYQSVDDYIAGSAGWRDELCKLRAILAATELEETVKWGMPCYTHRGKNVVALAAFKSYVGLWFFQGALLQDQRSVLINAQQGKTKSQRQWRFENLQEIKPRFVKAYIAEAMRVAEQDQHVPKQQKKPAQVPTELVTAGGEIVELRHPPRPPRSNPVHPTQLYSAVNAALFAGAILAGDHPQIESAWKDYRRQQTEHIAAIGDPSVQS